MARPRIALGESVDAEIATRTARGEAAETVWWAIGKVASVATIRRRMRELRDAAARGTCPTCGRSR